MPIARFALPLALVTSACASGPPAPAPPPVAATPVEIAPAHPAPLLLSAHVNGTVLHYRVTGTGGTTVVLVHGVLGDLDTWNAQLAAFSATHRVLTYALRYHAPNRRDEDGQTYSPGAHARDLAALLDSLGLGPAHVVGASYGAYVALALALERPELIRSLVLGEPPVLPLLRRTPAGDALRRAFDAAALDPARVAFRRGDSVEALRRLTAALGGTPERFDALPDAGQATLLAQAYALRRALLADADMFAPTLGCPALGRIAAPVLLLHGDRSPPLFHVIMDELARCLSSETVVMVPQAGHRMEAANPAFYNQAVLQFLATH